MKRAFLYILLVSFLLPACNMSSRMVKKGDKRFDRGEYDVAQEYYHKALNKGKDPGEVNFRIGESFRVSNRIKKALPYYQAAVNNGYTEDHALFYLAHALKANEKYEEAKKIFDQLSVNATDEMVKEESGLEEKNLRVLQEIMSNESYFRVKNLNERSKG